MADTKILAICGKGGVGKTSISALMVKILADRNGRKILAIDADPAVGLATALGITVNRSVDDIRKDLITGIRKGEPQAGPETLKRLDYEVFGALHESDRFALLAIGRPEDEGCFCKVNNLLKEIIADTSVKGLGVANAIAKVAGEKKAVDFKCMGLVLNRVRALAEVDDISTRTDLDIYGWLSDDDLNRAIDFKGEPLTGMPDTSPSIAVAAGILGKLGVLP
jgi:CO dehydrogenase maturation factor